jgi:hypothetical protein
MKKLLLLIILLTGAYFIYQYLNTNNSFEVKDNIIISQPSGLDINAGPSPPVKYAHIEGVIKNVGEKSLGNIQVVYIVGYDTLSANVGFLSAGGHQNLKQIIAE